MPETRMYGLWDSPITGKTLATSLRLSEPCWDTDGRTLAWVEGRSDRGVLVVQEDGGAPRDLTSDLSVRAFVGYGGGDFTLAHGAAYFVAQADQRIYRQEIAGGSARPITPAFGAATTPTISPDGRWLAYVHTVDGVDAIAVVDTSGKHWPQRFAEGRDFYMQPTWDANGERLSWVEWDHPQMPWDGCEMKIANVAFPEGGLPVATSTWVVAGDANTAVYQPIFSRDGRSLVFGSDETGIGHLYRRDLSSGSTQRLTHGEGDFTAPAWNHGMRRIAVTPGGTVVGVRNEMGFDRLTAIAPGGTVTDLRDRLNGYTVISNPVASPVSQEIAFVAQGSAVPARVVVLDLATSGPARIARRSDGETVAEADLADAQPMSWTSFDGEQAHGIYYAPKNSRFESTGAPPLIISIHGGPTSQVQAGWAPQAQFFATRGYAVLQPNYRGSTGYGRNYMLKLRNSWGIYDVQDAKSGAEELVRRGLADGTRIVIMGGSAGGFTVLQSLVEMQGFYKAGLSLFGVANQFLLAADTHKFEARYLDSLLGPLPEAAAIYRERSPYFHARKITDPLAVFQGEIDRVVPRNQSDEIVAALRQNGVPHVYHIYPGEGHGWRKSETIEQFYSHVDAFLRQYVIYG